MLGWRMGGGSSSETPAGLAGCRWPVSDGSWEQIHSFFSDVYLLTVFQSPHPACGDCCNKGLRRRGGVARLYKTQTTEIKPIRSQRRRFSEGGRCHSVTVSATCVAQTPPRDLSLFASPSGWAASRPKNGLLSRVSPHVAQKGDRWYTSARSACGGSRTSREEDNESSCQYQMSC